MVAEKIAQRRIYRIWKESWRASGISPEVGADKERDAVPIAARRRPMEEQIDSFLWVPYVHYGA